MDYDVSSSCKEKTIDWEAGWQKRKRESDGNPFLESNKKTIKESGDSHVHRKLDENGLLQ